MMKRLLLSVVLAALLIVPAFGQQTSVLSNTTFSAAVSQTTTSVTVASVSGSGNGAIAPAVGHELCVDLECMQIRAISGTTLTVSRGYDATSSQAHASGAVVWTGPTNYYQHAEPPFGACVAANVIVRPWINVKTMNVWLCRSSAWIATNVANITFNSVTPY